MILVIQRRLFFNFLPYEVSSNNKELLFKVFSTILPKEIGYFNFVIEFELLYRSILDLSMKSGERGSFKTRLKGISLSSLKLFKNNSKSKNNLSAEEIN